MVRHYAPMYRSITSICVGLDSEQLSVIRVFLRAVTAAGVDAASDLRDVLLRAASTHR